MSHVFYCFRNEKRLDGARLPVVTFEGSAIKLSDLKRMIIMECFSNDTTIDLRVFDAVTNVEYNDIDNNIILRNSTVSLMRVPKEIKSSDGTSGNNSSASF